MMVEFNVIMKGKHCKFKIENKVIYMASENTGGHLIELGKPLELKRKVLMSRNRLPSIFVDFIKAWRQEDIERVSKMETDKEMAEDMMYDFKLMGHEVLNQDAV